MFCYMRLDQRASRPHRLVAQEGSIPLDIHSRMMVDLSIARKSLA